MNPLSSGSGVECPFGFGGGSSDKWEKIAARRSEAVDPRNMMPKFSQEKAPDQRVDLSVEREKSSTRGGLQGRVDGLGSIPKTGSEGTWVYPSPQQFYHALR